MKLQANWSGVLARFDTVTTDGRVLAPPSPDDMRVFGGMPVPVYVLVPEQNNRIPVRIGTVVNVSVDGRELQAGGTIDVRSCYYGTSLALADKGEVYAAVDLDQAEPHCAVGGLLSRWRLRGVLFSLENPRTWEDPCVVKLDWRE